MKNLKKIFLIATLLVAVSIGGVSASWQYYLNPTPAGQSQAEITMGVFEYAPEEVLPGDKEATNLHENHLNLINNIVNHIDYGLNATKKPIVRELLEDGVPVVYSNQNVSGGNLKHMMLDSSDVESLMFAVAYYTDTEYHAYTFSSAKVKSGLEGTVIDVYKTIIVKENNKWVAKTSFKGTAIVSAVRGSDGATHVSIGVDTWK